MFPDILNDVCLRQMMLRLCRNDVGFANEVLRNGGKNLTASSFN